MTGLVNRKGFDLALAARLSATEASKQGTCALIADIDHFKRVNDTYGHLFGDKVICAVAKILKANVKGQDTVACYGGEEFFVLLPETTPDGARALAEKIRLTIEASRVRRADNNQEIARITVSLGVAAYGPGETAGKFPPQATGLDTRLPGALSPRNPERRSCARSPHSLPHWPGRCTS